MKLKLMLAAAVAASQLHAQTYITNVTVADVEKQRLLKTQTVVIENDIITAVRPAGKIKPPAGATVIDGTGKFLLPGLSDAHIHFFQNGGLYTRPDAIDLRKYVSHQEELSYAHRNMENMLRRYLYQGITNLVDVGASYAFLKQRDDFKNQPYAPGIYMTGPLLTTYQPPIYENMKEDRPFSFIKTEADAVKMVQEQLPYKPDFIKIWFIITQGGRAVEASARESLPVIKAAIDEAHRQHLKVAVHATQRIAAQLAVENGADFLVHSVDDEIIKEDFIQLLKKNKTILCPSLVVTDNYAITFAQKHQFTAHELMSADPHQLGSLLDLKHLSDTSLVKVYKQQGELLLKRAGKADSVRMANLKLLSDAQVLIATGTDAGNIGTLHASSYLSELQAMRRSGMSNWQILTASTLNGARVVGRQAEFGSIAAGKKANLLLLNASPVDSLENLTKIDRIINRGLIINRDTLLPATPEDLVQKQLNAYNLRDIEGFLEPYAEDVELYMYPDTLLGKGRENMRQNYTSMFKNIPDLHCELAARIVQGNVVIDHEKVRMENNIISAVAIYHITNGKISKVYFIQ